MTAIAVNSLPSSFQLSMLGVGAIVTGVDDINQCIDIILRTVPGSDPLRPLFGSYVYQYIDKPVDIAIPNGKKEIFTALDLWEPRITVVSITHELIVSQIIFNIGWVSVDGLTKGSTSWYSGGLTNTNQSSGTILTALIPTKLTNGVYRVSFSLDGKAVYPAPPAQGFATAVELLAWVNQNWYNYGKWYINGVSLVLYLNPGLAKKAFLAVTQVVEITVRALIPVLASNSFFNLAFTADGTAAAPVFPANQISTLEKLLLWTQNNWGNYGSFTIETDGQPTLLPGDFTNDYSNDFLKQRSHINRYLVFQTEQYLTATLQFS